MVTGYIVQITNKDCMFFFYFDIFTQRVLQLIDHKF